MIERIPVELEKRKKELIKIGKELYGKSLTFSPPSAALIAELNLQTMP